MSHNLTILIVILELTVKVKTISPYDISEHILLSDKDENTQNENELEMKGFLFESSKVMISVAMVLICHTVFTFHCQVLHYPIFCGSYT